jgi:hypothetical protein
MALQAARTWLTDKDFVTRASENFVCTIAKDTLGSDIPEDDSLPLVYGVDTVRRVR